MELGLRASGHETSLFCEIDQDASTVLAGRFSRKRVFPDVRDVEGLAASIDRHSDLLTAGFPCTDLSQAGLTQGLSGKNSGLILDVLKLLQLRPFNSVLIENVPNWRVLHGGQYLRHVLDALEDLGYKWAYRVVDAMSFGIPQRRERIFVYAVKSGDPRTALFPGNVQPQRLRYGPHEAAHGFYWTEGNRGLGWGENCVPTLKGGSGVGIPSAPAIVRMDGSFRTPDIRDAERLQGFAAGWTDFVGRLTLDGKRAFAPRKRWLLVGNAVNVAVSTWIGRNLATTPDISEVDYEPCQDTGPLPRAAWYDGERRWSTPATSWPEAGPRQALESFLHYEGALLSWRASAGFQSRALKSTLRFEPWFKPLLARHVERMRAEEAVRARAA